MFIDFGSDANFMDFVLVSSLGLKTHRLQTPIEAFALDGRLICKVTHHTQSLLLSFPDSHTERISFHVFKAPQHSLILGHEPGDILGKGVQMKVFPWPQGSDSRGRRQVP